MAELVHVRIFFRSVSLDFAKFINITESAWFLTRPLVIVLCAVGDLPESVLIRYDLLGTYVHGRL
jgi:hypothetical protein